MPEITWTERYNSHRARLPLGEMEVFWADGGGFTVRVCGRLLAVKSPDPAHGKARAIAFARKIALDTIAMLDAPANAAE